LRLCRHTTIKSKIDQTNTQIDNIHKKEEIFRNELDNFLKDIEINVCLPKLTEAIKSEINLILKTKNEKLQEDNANISPEQVETIGILVLQYLSENKLLLKDISLSELVDFVIASANNKNATDEYEFWITQK